MDIEELMILASNNECDGICDEYYPYIKCKFCWAKELLNELWDNMIEEPNIKFGIPRKLTDDLDQCKHGFHGHCPNKGCEHNQKYE